MLFADELDIHLLPKVGYQWMPKGEVVELVTPGQNQKRYLAGALDTLTGKVMHCIGKRKTALLFVELLQARLGSGRKGAKAKSAAAKSATTKSATKKSAKRR